MGKIFIVIGIVFVLFGILISSGVKFFKLPGDIYIQKENFSFYFPITTSILLSIILSLVFYIFFRFLK